MSFTYIFFFLVFDLGFFVDDARDVAFLNGYRYSDKPVSYNRCELYIAVQINFINHVEAIVRYYLIYFWFNLLESCTSLEACVTSV